jgi:hypothetical protein
VGTAVGIGDGLGDAESEGLRVAVGTAVGVAVGAAVSAALDVLIAVGVGELSVAVPPHAARHITRDRRIEPRTRLIVRPLRLFGASI